MNWEEEKKCIDRLETFYFKTQVNLISIQIHVKTQISLAK